MALKGKPLLLTTSDQDVYVCPATQEASVHALVFSNLTAGAITVSIKRYIAATASTQQLVAALSVAANGTENWPKPMNLAVGDKIIASASANSSVVCDYGAYENSATPAAVGFTGKGTWSSATAYVANDVVTYNSNSYLAIQAGTNQNPASATAYWMLLAAQGPAGTGDVTGPASATNNNVAVFDGTTGKLIKQGTAGTDYVAPGTATTFTAAQRGSISALTDGATITPDFAAANNYSVTLGGNRTLANPTNLTAGQSGSIFITQDGTGSRTLAYGSYWDFAGGTAPVLSTAASSVDRIDYIVRSTTSIHAVLTKALS